MINKILASGPTKLILSVYFLSFQFFWMVDNSPIVKELYKSFAFKVATKVIGKIYVLFFIPHCFMPFGLLKSRIYLPGIKVSAIAIYLHVGVKVEEYFLGARAPSPKILV